MLEAPNSEERSRLVGVLISQFFSAYRTLAGIGESYVSLDEGLSRAGTRAWHGLKASLSKTLPIGQCDCV